MRARILTALTLLVLAAAAPAAHAGWYSANTGSYFALTGSPPVPGPGISVTLTPNRGRPPHTAQCASGIIDGTLYPMANGSGAAITDMLLGGWNCTEAGSPVTFTCTLGRYHAGLFQALGGSSPNWYGSKTEGFLRSVACTYGVAGCTAWISGTLSVNWFNETAVGYARLYLSGPTNQAITFTVGFSSACVAAGLSGATGTVAIAGASPTPLPNSVLYFVSTPYPGPRMWEQ